MIDFHSHCLPEIDDGAKDVNMSIEMLHDSFLQGVRTVVATPHCYLKDEDYIDEFIEKRNNSYNILTEAVKNQDKPCPEIILGCEFHPMKEISDVEVLKKLCIGNTDYLLVEMPYRQWKESHFELLHSLSVHGITPIMAHIERYWDKRELFSNLYSLDVAYQINAESFIDKRDRKNVEKLFSEGAVNIIGSDMHDTKVRKSYMQDAKKQIEMLYGEERFSYLMSNASKILNNEPIEKKDFIEKGFFEKLFKSKK